jgi:hypothetical protein
MSSISDFVKAELKRQFDDPEDGYKICRKGDFFKDLRRLLKHCFLRIVQRSIQLLLLLRVVRGLIVGLFGCQSDTITASSACCYAGGLNVP